ncbi:MAG: hypothetical protein R6X12_05100 [bacterium]
MAGRPVRARTGLPERAVERFREQAAVVQGVADAVRAALARRDTPHAAAYSYLCWGREVWGR